MSHGDKVKAAPADFQVDATSSQTPIAAMSHPDKQRYAVQFHPEVRHSEYGNDVMKHFVFDACGCVGDWTLTNCINREVTKIQMQCGLQQDQCTCITRSVTQI